MTAVWRGIRTDHHGFMEDKKTGMNRDAKGQRPKATTTKKSTIKQLDMFFF